MLKLVRKLALSALGLCLIGGVTASLIGPIMVGGQNTGEGGLAIVDLLVATPAKAQQFNLGPNATLLGKVLSAVAPGDAQPTPTNGTLGAGSSSSFGKVTVTSGASNVVVTFATAWKAAPICYVVNTNGVSTNALKWTTSTTALTVTANTMATSDVLNYFCIGQQR